jgi:hypothetical protein
VVAAEGGAWGIARLAVFCASRTHGSLAEFLNADVFADTEPETVEPDSTDVAGFNAFIQRYVAALPVERARLQDRLHCA